MSEAAVLSEREGAIGIITVNRPDKLNALDLATIEAMGVAFLPMAIGTTPCSQRS